MEKKKKFEDNLVKIYLQFHLKCIENLRRIVFMFQKIV